MAKEMTKEELENKVIQGTELIAKIKAAQLKLNQQLKGGELTNEQYRAMSSTLTKGGLAVIEAQKRYQAMLDGLNS